MVHTYTGFAALSNYHGFSEKGKGGRCNIHRNTVPTFDGWPVFVISNLIHGCLQNISDKKHDFWVISVIVAAISNSWIHICTLLIILTAIAFRIKYLDYNYIYYNLPRIRLILGKKEKKYHHQGALVRVKDWNLGSRARNSTTKTHRWDRVQK